MNSKQKRKKNRIENNILPDSDETFAYIAGYTSNGVPFGVTWEEQENMDKEEPLAYEEEESMFEKDFSYKFHQSACLDEGVIDDELPFK